MHTHAATAPSAHNGLAEGALRLFIIGDSRGLARQQDFAALLDSKLDFCGPSALFEDESALRRARAADGVLLDTLGMEPTGRCRMVRATLQALLRRAPGLHVISVVARRDRECARAAAQAGSWDVVELPASDFRDRILSAARLRTLSREAHEESDLERNSHHPLTLREARRIVERKTLRLALEHVGGNKTAAARVLAISRTQLYELMRRHGLLA